MIVTKNLQKAFGDHMVLKGIDQHIEKGEKVVVIGPSGSGKSTFLRCLNLLEQPTGGEIIFEGTTITDPSCNINELRQRMGMVFQQFNLFPHKTVRQNITLAPVLLGKMTQEQADQRAQELLARVGLPDKADAYPAQLSGGQQQRCAIARAIAVKPSLILADEPTGNLDKKTGREILQIFRELHQAGNTIVLITHDPKVAQSAERVIRIEDGQLYENQEVPQDDLPVV